MEMKYYNPSNNFRAPIPREPKAYRPPQGIMESACESKKEKESPKVPLNSEIQKTEKHEICKEESKNILGNLTQDDIVILGVLFLLLINSCDDYLLLLALGFLFISGRQK